MNHPNPTIAGACMAAAAMIFAGCSRHDAGASPIAKGQILYVQLGDKPVLRGGEIGSWSAQTFQAGTIEIYQGCVIITEPDGTKHMAPPERFGAIRFK